MNCLFAVLQCGGLVGRAASRPSHRLWQLFTYLVEEIRELHFNFLPLEHVVLCLFADGWDLVELSCHWVCFLQQIQGTVSEQLHTSSRIPNFDLFKNGPTLTQCAWIQFLKRKPISTRPKDNLNVVDQNRRRTPTMAWLDVFRLIIIRTWH